MLLGSSSRSNIMDLKKIFWLHHPPMYIYSADYTRYTAVSTAVTAPVTAVSTAAVTVN